MTLRPTIPPASSFYLMEGQTRYCRSCGSGLLVESRRTVRYEDYDGSPVVELTLRCPNWKLVSRHDRLVVEEWSKKHRVPPPPPERA